MRIDAIIRLTVLFLTSALFSLTAWAQEKDKSSQSDAQPEPTSKVVHGRVIDKAGKPIAGAQVSRLWYTNRKGEFAAFEPVKTDVKGEFSIELTFYYNRGFVLSTFDLEKKQGGLTLVEPKKASDEATITAAPLVHFHGSYECKDLQKPIGWTNTILFANPGRINFMNSMSTESKFDFWLPPGKYEIQGYGTSDVTQIKREIEIPAGKADLDLGAIDLAASQITKLKGKPAPKLLATDARGVSKDVQVSDYKGKWVALEFWGWWCGPCVARALPEMMEIYDDHENERDKFVVITVHAPDAKTFAEVDEKVKPVVEGPWDGRMIPFPILLDADGEIQETFGVNHWPTTLLFDPEGKLVGEVQPAELAAKLEPIPLAIALPRKLDRNIYVIVDDPTIKLVMEELKFRTGVDVDLDKDALESLGLSESTKLPIVISGRVSLRSALELLLEPVGLTAKIGAKGFIVTRKPGRDSSGKHEDSVLQQYCAKRIERKFKESKFTYEFKETPLAKAAMYFEDAAGRTWFWTQMDASRARSIRLPRFQAQARTYLWARRWRSC